MNLTSVPYLVLIFPSTFDDDNGRILLVSRLKRKMASSYCIYGYYLFTHYSFSFSCSFLIHLHFSFFTLFSLFLSSPPKSFFLLLNELFFSGLCFFLHLFSFLSFNFLFHYFFRFFFLISYCILFCCFMFFFIYIFISAFLLS